MPEEGGPLYELALTHRSFAFENGSTEHNERLEFLGDAILGAIVTDLIFTSYPDLSEGAMAPLRASVVNTNSLADIAREMGLGDHIKLGKGEEISGGRDKPSLLADALEAIIAAVYVERGMEAAREAIVPVFEGRIAAAVTAGNRFDPKAALQEMVVRGGHPLPAYQVAGSGPDHDKRFEAEVYVGGNLMGSGRGRSKKEAEQEAARRALESMVHEGGAADARAS